MTAGTGNSISGTAIASENSESLVTHPEQEGYTEDELMNVTGESLVGETKYVQEDSDEGETKVDEVVGKFIRRRQSYYIDFQIGVVISYEQMKQYWDPKCLN